VHCSYRRNLQIFPEVDLDYRHVNVEKFTWRAPTNRLEFTGGASLKIALVRLGGLRNVPDWRQRRQASSCLGKTASVIFYLGSRRLSSEMEDSQVERRSNLRSFLFGGFARGGKEKDEFATKINLKKEKRFRPPHWEDLVL
jgi:hypothetical protein